MTGMLLYIALGLMILTVLSNRFWRRQLVSARVSLSKLKETADDASKELSDAAKEYAAVDRHITDTERRAGKAEQELAATRAEYEAKRDGPVRRYYIFDRLEPRQGRFYEAAVRYDPNAASEDRAIHRAWSGVRRYVLVAETEREARERIGNRFTRKLGFEVVEVAPCRLAGLTVNRIAELSTFRRPSTGEDDEPARRPARRAARA
ncbi:hypothetical protein [Azospirillum sp. TSO22-1]|uniref:hypothetical protein n=1 Tax=Azospirillum sp. TSO22-1 TaxID=716789 RepID=UPI000D61D909|nr:hypothetical protein [Azospirillum sp. TSO22-1]PWC38516.1 hypothetical protein TSO221_26680 [Azospirillum sp. TSO22-1]